MADYKISELTVSNDGADIGDLWVTSDSSTTLYFNGDSWEDVQSEQENRMERMEKMIEKIADRLAVLEDPDPEKLEQFKTLQDAYTKYKFVEKLCGEKE